MINVLTNYAKFWILYFSCMICFQYECPFSVRQVTRAFFGNI